MKKIQYCSPAIEVCQIEPQTMISVSDLTSTNIDGLGVSSDAYEDEARVKGNGDHSSWNEGW
ncbi:MAG: hypothetical protein K6F94_09270 [Bacteroidaceae bacterium]|nr:hypothetical protein [Bacteroidaceae bacterium]